LVRFWISEPLDHPELAQCAEMVREQHAAHLPMWLARSRAALEFGLELSERVSELQR
jgi:hypothetical protein